MVFNIDYNIGDVVYFMYENGIRSGRVIEIECAFDGKDIKYVVRAKSRGVQVNSSSFKLYETVDELLLDLVDNMMGDK